MSRTYHVIETKPGEWFVRAGEYTNKRSEARHYTTPQGAARGLGMARQWDLLDGAKIVEVRVDS